MGEKTSRLLPLAASSPIRTAGHIAAQEGHAFGGLWVFGMVGEDEHRPLPGAAVVRLTSG